MYQVIIQYGFLVSIIVVMCIIQYVCEKKHNSNNMADIINPSIKYLSHWMDTNGRVCTLLLDNALNNNLVKFIDHNGDINIMDRDVFALMYKRKI